MKYFLTALIIISLCSSCALVKPIRGHYHAPSSVTVITSSSPDEVWERFTDFIVDYGLKPQIIDPTSGLFFLNDCTFATTVELGKRNFRLENASAPFVSSAMQVGNQVTPVYNYVKADINLKVKKLADNQTEIKIHLSNWQVFKTIDKTSYWISIINNPASIQSTRAFENLVFEKIR